MHCLTEFSDLYITKNIGVEHCKMKLENYIGIVVAMSVALIEDNTTSNTAPRETDATSSPSDARVPQSRRTSLTTLLTDLVAGMESELEKLSQVVENHPIEKRKDTTSFLPSTGGRPAFNITK